MPEKHYGRLGLAKVMAPAIRLARDGFVLSDDEARAFHAKLLEQFPESASDLFSATASFMPGVRRSKAAGPGTHAGTHRGEPGRFYARGKWPPEIAAFEAKNGGNITAADLAAYQCKERIPLVGHYRGYEVLTSPPPSSGGIVLLETLNILSGYDLAKLGADRSPAQIHIITEAFRRAYMDRGDYLGDPDFNHNPLTEMNNPESTAAAWRQDDRRGETFAFSIAA